MLFLHVYILNSAALSSISFSEVTVLLQSELIDIDILISHCFHFYFMLLFEEEILGR